MEFQQKLGENCTQVMFQIVAVQHNTNPWKSLAVYYILVYKITVTNFDQNLGPLINPMNMITRLLILRKGRRCVR